MQAHVDWVLIIFGTQVIKKKRPVRPVFPDYLSVSYDYGKCNATYLTQIEFKKVKTISKLQPSHYQGSSVSKGIKIK